VARRPSEAPLGTILSSGPIGKGAAERLAKLRQLQAREKRARKRQQGQPLPRQEGSRNEVQQQTTIGGGQVTYQRSRPKRITY
jgi:hypothetical protein